MVDSVRPESSPKAPIGRIWRVARWILLVPVWYPLWCRLVRVIGWFLSAVGATVVVGGLCFVFAPEIIGWVDGANPEFFDSHLGTNQSLVAKLHEPGYFPEQTEIVSEKQEAVACISSPEHRVLVNDSADIPPLFQKAILASEDKNFFEHDGVDMWGVARAAFNQYVRHVSSSGASTLTMQVAKDLRHGMGRRSTVKEKVGDIIMAIRIEREFPSKLQVLRLYVNTPYFGRGQYGIEAASRAYFGKPARDLALHQVAFIVSLINKPALPDRQSTRDKRAKTPDEIKKANWQMVLLGTRRVLGLMLDDDSITDLEYARAAEFVDRTLAKEMLPRGRSCGANEYFLEYIRVTYKDVLPLNKGGLVIPVTRDDGFQDVLERAVKTTVSTYLARHQNDPDNGELRAGAFAIEFTGDVLAEVGNIDFAKYKYDVIARGWRQPGSAFKIFTYGGLVEQLTTEVLDVEHPPEMLEDIVAEVRRRCTVLDAPVGVSLGRGRGIKMIQNFHSNNPREKQYWGQMSCKDAVARSQNAAAIRAGARANIKHVIELTHRLGMPMDAKHVFQPYPTTAIGASEVNPLGMAGAVTFMNGGFKITPRFVNDVCKDGRSLLSKNEDGGERECDMKGERRPMPERSIHPAVSVVMMDILQGPLNDEFGTAKSLRRGVIPGMDILGSEVWKLKPEERRARTLAFPVETSGEIGGKTGTATNADGRTSDVWLVLFIPGPVDRPEKGVMLVFWMGKDSKDHALGERGSHGGRGFAETGGRNWTHSAAMVLSFLQKERGLLKPEHRFQPIYQDDVLINFGSKKHDESKGGAAENPDEIKIIDPSDPNTDPKLLELLPPPDPDEAKDPEVGAGDEPRERAPD